MPGRSEPQTPEPTGLRGGSDIPLDNGDEILVEMFNKTLGWGVAAGLLFCGWLIGGFTLDAREAPRTYLLVCFAVLVIGFVWWTCVERLWRYARRHPLHSATTFHVPRVAVIVYVIVFAITLLSGWDDTGPGP